MAIMGVALGVTSIVSVHLISASVAQQLDKLVPGSLAQFSHFLHRDALTAQDYFDLRRRWRAGEVGEIESMSPIIDESLLLGGQTVRVIGIDLFSAGADLRESDITSAGETNSTTQWSWQGVWVDHLGGCGATAGQWCSGFTGGQAHNRYWGGPRYSGMVP